MFSSTSQFQEQLKNKKEIRRWWLFHATNFQSLMYPCFFFCRILGIFPYNINASSLETSKLCYFFSIIVKCVYGICMLIIMTNFYEWFGTLDEHRKIQLITINILYIFIIYITFVSNGPRMRLLQTILKISSRLSPEMYRKQSMLIHSKDIFSFFFLLIYSLICYYYVHFNVLLQMFFLYNTLLVFQINMLYINCVCVLKACFKKINDDLANLLINDKSHAVEWINSEQRNLVLLFELKTLKKQHLMLSDTVQKLNIIFSPQLLATIILHFIHVTFEIYLKMVQVQNGPINWIILTNHFSVPYVVILFVKIALISWACETGKNEAKKISTMVHDVLNSSNEEKIKKELRVFSLQILHRDNTFSAKSRTMDATLLSDMMGTVTTYVLILFQFLVASNSCNRKTENNVT